jgi:hypothetical protein
MNRSGAIGTRAETAVVRAISPWWPHAERRRLRGSLDCGDITGTPGVAWEIKGGKAAQAASDGRVAVWLTDTERERQHARATHGVLIVARPGIGPANARRWWAIMPLRSVVQLTAGRGRAVPSVIDAGMGDVPIRMTVEDACRMLAHGGFGTVVPRDARGEAS